MRNFKESSVGSRLYRAWMMKLTVVFETVEILILRGAFDLSSIHIWARVNHPLYLGQEDGES